MEEEQMFRSPDNKSSNDKDNFNSDIFGEYSNAIEEENIKCSPVKRFFVEMLTRDIDIRDAIMDLLDNCIDGMIRKGANKNTNKPYEDFKAEISFNESSFRILDNCGGIPKEIAVKYAFRMGRPKERELDEDGSTIGMYGIGMKRAIFKIGKNAKIISRHKNDGCYKVDINQSWLEDDTNWDLPIVGCTEELDGDGTSIYVTDLYPGIKTTFSFGTGNFLNDLISSISVHYGTIIERGFKIFVNGEPVKPAILKLEINKNYISENTGLFPYIFEEKTSDMEISFIVGITEATPDYEDMERESSRRLSSSIAGWTVIANDRVVLQADKSRVTGWGDGNPLFHYQFNSIVGVVEFKSKDPFKLPITTTKKGLDTSSDVYLHIRKQMMEGLQVIIDYTNKWKNRKDEEKEKILKHVESMSIKEIETEIVKKIDEHLWREKTDGEFTFKIYKPDLPKPEKEAPENENISFRKNKNDVKTVKAYLTNINMLDENASRHEVGSKCFDYVKDNASRGGQE